MPMVIYTLMFSHIIECENNNKDVCGMKLEQIIAEGTGENLPLNKDFENNFIKISTKVKTISHDLQEIQQEITIKSKTILPLCMTYYDISEETRNQYHLLWEKGEVVRKNIEIR